MVNTSMMSSYTSGEEDEDVASTKDSPDFSQPWELSDVVLIAVP